MLRRFGVFLATGAYIGYAPVAPGTFGSAIGIGIFYLVRSHASPTLEALVIGVLLGVGIWSAAETERFVGRTDPGPVVIDEIVGMLITLAFVPVNAAGVLLGFLVFRTLDVVKPWPARRLERLHGGLGIMMDDVMAAVYGNLMMWGAVRLFPGLFA